MRRKLGPGFGQRLVTMRHPAYVYREPARRSAAAQVR
jgi:hypothetical protein